MRAFILVALLLAPAIPSAGAQEDGGGWSDPRPFRLTIELGGARDPLEDRPIALARDQLVLVPVDITAALRAAGTWPFDAAGRPLAWTLAPETLRVVAAGSDATLPAQLLAYSLREGAGEHDPSANAVATLAVILPAGTRALHVYFDIAEHAAATTAPLPAEARARLDDLGGLGPWVASLAHVPRTPPGASPALVVLAPDGASVRVQRLQPGAAPALLAQADVPLAGAIDLPPTEQGYDVSITADRPILALLRTSADAGGAFFHAALDGGAAGGEFLLATPGRAHAIGTRAGTSVSVTDARTGAPVASASVGRLGAVPIDVREGTPLKVTTTAPVLVLHQAASSRGSDGFLHAGRAIGGEAAGTLVLAARGGGHAALASAPATAQAFPLASPQSVTSGRAEPAWVARGVIPTASEPWAFSAAQPLSVLTGSDGYAPLSGIGGRAFDVPIASSRDAASPAEHPLAARILAPFGGTRVDVERASFDGSSVVAGSIDVGARTALTTIPGKDEDLAAEGSTLRVDATRPVFVTLFRPGAPAVAPIPGLPPVVTSTRVALEHFGAILAWTPLASFHAARPGETTRIELTLANLGRTREGEGIIENAALSVEPARSARCRAEWEVTLPEASADGLASPGQRDVEAFVVVPPDASPGDCMEIEIAARSSFDPSVESIARATIRARSGFQPELRVVRPDGEPAASASVTLEAGVLASIELRLRNLGGEDGTALVRHARAPGYDSRIVTTPGGEAVDRLPMGGGAQTRLWLELRAPTGVEPPWDFVVQATSAADPSARDEVVVTATPRADLDLRATVDERRVLLTPGGSASARVEVANLGSDVEVQARVTSALPDDWSANVSPARLLLRATGARGDLGARLDLATLAVVLRAPASARVGDTVPLAIALEASGSVVRVPLLAVVANDLRLDTTLPGTIVAGPGDVGATVVELVSRAPAPMNVSVRSVAAPTGWRIEASGSSIALAPGEAYHLTLRHAIEPLAPAGTGVVALRLQLEDPLSPPRAIELDLPAVTAARTALRVDASPARVVLSPGEVAPVLLRLTNDGNVPAPLDPATSGPLAMVGGLPASLAPGGSIALSATVGPAIGVATFDVGGERATIDVVAATRDVRIVAAAARERDGVRYLDVEIENAGTLPTGALELEIAAGDASVASVELPGLRNGQRARHTLLAPVAADGLRIELASAIGLADDAPADNVWTIAAPVEPTSDVSGLASAQRAVPAPSLAVALLALVALAWRRSP